MRYSTGITDNPARRMIILQAMLGSLVIAFFWLKDDEWAAASALYGVSVAVFIARVLAGSIRLASGMSSRQASSAMAVLYAGAVMRFVLVLLLLGLGLWQLNLAPVAMLCGFAVVQLGYPLLVMKRKQ